jgi:hypothetical protein
MLTRDQMLAKHLLPLLSPLILTVRQFQLQEAGEIDLPAPDVEVAQVMRLDLKYHPMTVLYTIFKIVEEAELGAYLAAANPAIRTKLLSFMTSACHRAVTQNAFVEMWLTMNMFQLITTVKVIGVINSQLMQYYIGESFDVALWLNFFKLCFDIMKVPAMQIESFVPAKQDFVLKSGDLRIAVIAELKRGFDCLEVEHRNTLISAIIPNLITLLTRYPFYKPFALELFTECTVVEYTTTGEFSQVERHTVDHIYKVVSKQEAKDQASSFMEDLVKSLSARYVASEELKVPGQEFLTHLQRVFGLVSKFMTMSMGEAQNKKRHEDSCAELALNLMNYLENSGHVREEMQTGYIQYLVNFHNDIKNHIEAAMTQQSQLRMLRWSDEVCVGTNSYPRESHRLRKVRLYESAISHFEEGKAYERCIQMLQELKTYYQHEQFDFAEVAKLSQREADYWLKIGGEDRNYPHYFRVQFFGPGFDDPNWDLRNKVFVYRGEILESPRDFSARIQDKFSPVKVHIIMKVDVPTPELEEEKKYIISIAKLDLVPVKLRRPLLEEFQKSQGVVVPELKHPTPPELDNHVLPGEVNKQLENNIYLRVFEYSKGVQKSTEKRPANEFKTLWVAKTYLFTEESFPTNRRRIPVTWTKEVEITPVENAITMIANKNVELRAFYTKLRAIPKAETKSVDVEPLTRCLNGILDAAVNGGTMKYVEAFLTDRPEYEHEIKWHAEMEVPVFALPTIHSVRCNEYVRRHDVVVEMERRGDWLRHSKGWSIRRAVGSHGTVQEFFESKDSTRVVPDASFERQRCTDLKDSIREQMLYVEQGMVVFLDRCPQNLLPLSEHLQTMQKKVSTIMTPIVST